MDSEHLFFTLMPPSLVCGSHIHGHIHPNSLTSSFFHQNITQHPTITAPRGPGDSLRFGQQAECAELRADLPNDVQQLGCANGTRRAEGGARVGFVIVGRSLRTVMIGACCSLVHWLRVLLSQARMHKKLWSFTRISICRICVASKMEICVIVHRSTYQVSINPLIALCFCR